MIKTKYIIGIDEAGRGPLAGPVAVGVALTTVDFDWTLLQGVGDSKKLSAKNRLAIFGRTKKLKRVGKLDYAVAMVSAKIIDQIGIVPAINRALGRALSLVLRRNLLQPSMVRIKLDGGLRAPNIYLQQETIIKGDDKELLIGLASIMAKVTRDSYMEKISHEECFINYDFAVHKGYGTKRHREAIVDYGLSPEHRRSFCRNITVK